MRWLVAVVLGVAVFVAIGAVSAQRRGRYLIGLCLAAGLVVADLLVAFTYMESTGGRW